MLLLFGGAFSTAASSFNFIDPLVEFESSRGVVFEDEHTMRFENSKKLTMENEKEVRFENRKKVQ